MTLESTRPCPFGPFPPSAPIRLGRQTRLALEIAVNDNGEIEFTERDPRTWGVVREEGGRG